VSVLTYCTTCAAASVDSVLQGPFRLSVPKSQECRRNLLSRWQGPNRFVHATMIEMPVFLLICSSKKVMTDITRVKTAQSNPVAHGNCMHANEIHTTNINCDSRDLHLRLLAIFQHV
jgi:hypothetical protein